MSLSIRPMIEDDTGKITKWMEYDFSKRFIKNFILAFLFSLFSLRYPSLLDSVFSMSIFLMLFSLFWSFKLVEVLSEKLRIKNSSKRLIVSVKLLVIDYIKDLIILISLMFNLNILFTYVLNLNSHVDNLLLFSLKGGALILSFSIFFTVYYLIVGYLDEKVFPIIDNTQGWGKFWKRFNQKWVKAILYMIILFFTLDVWCITFDQLKQDYTQFEIAKICSTNNEIPKQINCNNRKASHLGYSIKIEE